MSQLMSIFEVHYQIPDLRKDNINVNNYGDLIRRNVKNNRTQMTKKSMHKDIQNFTISVYTIPPREGGLYVYIQIAVVCFMIPYYSRQKMIDSLIVSKDISFYGFHFQDEEEKLWIVQTENGYFEMRYILQPDETDDSFIHRIDPFLDWLKEKRAINILF